MDRQTRRWASLATGILLMVAGCGVGSGGDAYEDTVRNFYRGLASLDAGLLDDARNAFSVTTDLAPEEPAGWANLGVTTLRLGAFDAASEAVAQAVALAPDDADVVFLAGVAEDARGRVDEAIERFRDAVRLDPVHFRARFALAEAVERAGGATADDDAQQQLEELQALLPDNLTVLLARVRLAAKRGDLPLLGDAAANLAARGPQWPAAAEQPLAALADAVARGASADAAVAIAFVRNVLARTPQAQADLAQVQMAPDLIAEPFAQFRRLPVPPATPSPPDTALAYEAEQIGGAARIVVAVPLDTSGAFAVLATDGSVLQRLDNAGEDWPFPGTADGVPPTVHGILPIDWNGDFRTDLLLAGSGGLRLLEQGDNVRFTDVTATAWGDTASLPVTAVGAWSADLEMDGDLDLIVGVTDGPPLVLRNNGDGTWMPTPLFDSVVGVRSMVWGDLDRDGDPDPAFLDASGVLHVFDNQQAGQFGVWSAPELPTPWVAVTIADSNADGRFELLGLDASGNVNRSTKTDDSTWFNEPALVSWPAFPEGVVPGTFRLWLADLDNSGSLDITASGGGASRMWLADATGQYASLTGTPSGEIFSVADITGDGQLDLVGLDAGQSAEFRGVGTLDYHWHLLRPQAQMNAGDQRINSFGVGGEAEVRSGLLLQKQLLTGGPVHFGLGSRSQVELARIVWPNGVAQAEFDLDVDAAFVAEQRLKGSCPWLFTWDGTGMQFVTDFLWRSPLGLRINAQDTAGITQTEDWVRIRGDQLVPRDGIYDLRITAELWETHFVDHVSLLVVDHPADVEVFVDERFAVPPPDLAVRATLRPTPVARAWDTAGREVTELLREQDNRFLDTFPLGRYQGVAAREHVVEFELGADVPSTGSVWLLGYGWVYPTDSSINVALGQGSHDPPRGLALDVLNVEGGSWRTVYPALGFPAGKNKTIMIDISSVAREAVRFRLRTNLEVYWDWLGSATAAEPAGLRTTQLTPTRADLSARGFSQTSFVTPRGPEIPRYDALANTRQRWRDLEGYYTRFGDVRELLDGVDDRYVIMNAGDEVRLEFAAMPPPQAGWARDFVLIGDGWVKDGDFNTSYSKTVGPLPSHRDSDYRMPLGGSALEADPVYQQHADDWQRFHTRYVTPRTYLDGLWREQERTP